MSRAAQLRRLHFLNTLFAPVTGHDLYLAGQIAAAITTSLEEATDSQREPSEPEFLAAATRLFAKLCAAQPRHGFFHWDALEADATVGSPLFARAALMTGLRQLSLYPEATLLVTNLRDAHCPPGRRWTPRRQRAYAETLALLRDLAAARTRRSAQLHVYFL